MTKTFLEIKEADQLVASLYEKDPNIQKGKFGYAWKKIIDKNYNPTITELNDKMTDNRVEYALTDEKTKELLKGSDGNYKYSKEGMKALLAAQRALIKEYDSKEIEVVPFYIKSEDLPELTDEEKETLKGLIIE